MSPIAHATTVGELMTPNPIAIRADAPLAEAATLLDQHGISGLPVVDAVGAVIGVVSQTDLVRARATEHLWSNWPGLGVRHLMTQPPLTVHASASVGEAAQLMEAHHVHRLIVVGDDERTPIGIISTTDLVRAIAGGEAS